MIKESGGFVYLLGDWLKEGVYKIGVTRGDVEKRIKKLQTGNAGEIYLVKKYYTKYPFFVERDIHMRLFGRKVKNEWFELSLDDIVNFENMCKLAENMVEIINNDPIVCSFQ